MAGLVPAIHVLDPDSGMDARHKAGHDEQTNLMRKTKWPGRARP
jgi:hypothetical protein